jgi:multiple antibiotic resistance protein
MAGLEAILVTVAALLPIVNPLGSAPIFLAHSADLPPAARQQLAWVVARNAFLLLVIAMLVGSHLLAFFGISIPIVRVAGGLVLLATGWQLLHAGDAPDAPPATITDSWQRAAANRGFYPLTFPLTVGPGSISVAITLGAAALDRPSGLMRIGAGVIGAAIVAASILVCYRSATRLISALGETGTDVFLRLSAFILLCVGVSIFWAGVVGLVQATRW